MKKWIVRVQAVMEVHGSLDAAKEEMARLGEQIAKLPGVDGTSGYVVTTEGHRAT